MQKWKNKKHGKTKQGHIQIWHQEQKKKKKEKKTKKHLKRNNQFPLPTV